MMISGAYSARPNLRTFTAHKWTLSLLIAFACSSGVSASLADADPSNDPAPSHLNSAPPLESGTQPSWSLQVGAAIITENNIGEVLSGQIDSAEGESGGQSYSLTLTWIAHRFEIPFRDRIFRPQFEPYATLTLVDQNGQSLFPDYNAGIGFRWVDFPWRRWLSTTFYTGIGLSYSSHVYDVDRQRHPETDRSHLKLDWPIQLTFALPSWPQHQLVLFNDHHSGGHIFDEGGVNSLGIAYRIEF